jgi:beta-N-acetylhexosaminidase
VSLQRLAAGVLLPGFAGTRAPDWVQRLVEAGLGGVVLFARNVSDDLPALCASLSDVLIAIDEEGGDVTRLEASCGSSFPGNLALGAVDDVALTERVAAAIGALLAEVGVNVNLAPVADANTNPENPIVGVRAFGSEPELVARHTAAYVRGLQGTGVAACAKHFPGHGDTTGDSHLELPTVAGDVAAALAPFRAAVAAGVRCVMPGHLLVPELDPEAPASLSHRIVTELLRGELGFDGCVITDALEMRAVSATVGVEESAVRALAAGADGLCLGHDVDNELTGRVQQAIVAAVRDGRVTEARLADAGERVRTATRNLGVRPGSDPGLGAGTGSDPDLGAGAEAARRALRVTGDVAVEGTPQVILLQTEPTIAAGPVGFDFGDAIRRVWPAAAVSAVRTPGSDPGQTPPNRVVVVMRDAGRHRWQRNLVTGLLARRPDTIVVETGLPGWLPEGAATVTTYGAARVNLEAAVAALAQRRAAADAIPS